jgi:hypothetical protein
MELRCLFLAFLVLLPGIVVSDEIITLKDGRQIIVRDNKTWDYYTSTANPSAIERLWGSADMTGRIFSNSDNFMVYYDPSTWNRTTGLNAKADVQLENSNKNGWGILILDARPYPIEQMKSLIIINAQSADKNARLIGEEPVLVNGQEGMIITYSATVQSVRCVYYSLIMSNKKGTIQYCFYTIDTYFEELKPQFRKAISGLVF